MLCKRILIAITILSFSLGANLLKVSEFKGIDQKTAPDKIQTGRATDMTNLDFDVMGSLQTRKGISYIESKSGTIKNVNDLADNLYIYDKQVEYKDTIVSYDVNHYSNIRDDIYLFGNDMVKWDNESNGFRRLGYDSPEFLSGEVVGVTGNLYGTYNYAVTYEYNGTHESNPFYISDSVSGNIDFTNGKLALDFGSTKFYLQIIGNEFYGYYIESDVVKVKRKLLMTGVMCWAYYLDGYIYIVNRDFANYKFYYYKINIATVQIDGQNYDTFSNVMSATELNIDNPSFFVDSTGFYVASGRWYLVNAIGNPPKTWSKVKVYRYTGNWTTREDFSETTLFYNPYGYVPFMGVYGFYIENGTTYANVRGSLGTTYYNRIYRLSDVIYKEVTTPYNSIYPNMVVASGNNYINANSVLMNWDNPNGIITVNSTMLMSVGTTSNIQYLKDNVWYQYSYDLSVPSITIASSNTWDIETTATRLTAINQQILLTLPTDNYLFTTENRTLSNNQVLINGWNTGITYNIVGGLTLAQLKTDIESQLGVGTVIDIAQRNPADGYFVYLSDYSGWHVAYGTEYSVRFYTVEQYVYPENVRTKIYRQVDGTGYYLLDITDIDNSTYLDNISNINQSTVPMEIDNDKPPQSIDSEYIVARQFYLAPDGVIWYSKINKFESVPYDNYIPIRTNADDKPVRIIEHFGGLLVFFEKSIWYIDLQSASPLLWVPRKLNTDFGCPYMYSIVKGKLPDQQIGIFYMAEDKSIRVLTGVGSDSIQLFDNIYTDKLSLPIDNTLKADTTEVNQVYLAFYDYKLYVSISEYVFVWDSQLGGEWTKYELPINKYYIGELDGDLSFSDDKVLYKLESEEYEEPNLLNDFVSGNWVIQGDGDVVFNKGLYVNGQDTLVYQIVPSSSFSSSSGNVQVKFDYEVINGSPNVSAWVSEIYKLSETLSGVGTFYKEFNYRYINPSSIFYFWFNATSTTASFIIKNIELRTTQNKEEAYKDYLFNENLLETSTQASLDRNIEYTFTAIYSFSVSTNIKGSWFATPVEGSYYFDKQVSGNGTYTVTFNSFALGNFYYTKNTYVSTDTISIYLTRTTDDIRSIDWNYKTKVFGDSFEYYQDFDKIWLRGIQKATSDIRVDYTCNNDLGYYTDYILMSLYGDSIVNTGVNSLLGAGGRDIQLEFSGSNYVRLDAFSIKRTLREE